MCPGNFQQPGHVAELLARATLYKEVNILCNSNRRLEIFPL